MSTSGSSSGAAGGLLAANNLSDVASRQTSLNTLGGAVTAARFIRGDGTNLGVAAIQAGDVPTLNQNTSGTAAGLSANIAESQVTNLTTDLGTLTTAVAARAPIASPTFTGVVTTSQGVIVGAPVSPAGTGISVQGSVSTEGGFLGLCFIGTMANGNAARLDLRSSQGTIAVPTATLSGDPLAAINGGGWGATVGIDSIQVVWRAAQNFTDAAAGTAVDHYVTPNGTIVKVVAFTLDQDQSATFAGKVTAGRITAADGNTTIASTAITSATAAFTQADVGKLLSGWGITAGTTLAAVANPTTATLSANAVATSTTMPFTIGGIVGAAQAMPNVHQIDAQATNVVNVMCGGASWQTSLRGYAAAPAFGVERVNGTPSAGTPIVSGNVIASYQYRGATTTAANPTIVSGAAWRATATENWSGTAAGTKLEARVTANTTQTNVTAVTIDQDSSVAFAGNLSATGDASAAVTLALGTTNGLKIGTAITQKIGLYGVPPIAQRAGAAQTAVATTGSTITTPFGYTTAAQADAIVTLVNELRAWAVAMGGIKGAA